MAKHPPRGHSGGGAPPGQRTDRKPAHKPSRPFVPDRGRGRDERVRDAATHRNAASNRGAATSGRSEVWIYGFHPVAAALANPARKILRLLATTEAATRLRSDPSIPNDNLAHLRTVGRDEIDAAVGPEAVHQGVALLARPLEHDLADILDGLGDQTEVALVVLDQVTDPHNVGAVLRSAAAFNARAVIAPDRHAPDETGAMAKAASGALDRVPYVKTTNLVRALEAIKESRFWLVGLDADAPQTLSSLGLSGRIALVLGAEGEGLRRLTRETCDHLAKLPISAAVESLNVSNAAAIALYEKARQSENPSS